MHDVNLLPEVDDESDKHNRSHNVDHFLFEVAAHLVEKVYQKAKVNCKLTSTKCDAFGGGASAGHTVVLFWITDILLRFHLLNMV